MVSYMCTNKYFSYTTIKSVSLTKLEIQRVKIILKAYNFKNRKKGDRQIKMTLNNHLMLITT